jgi:hypothetical protein
LSPLKFISIIAAAIVSLGWLISCAPQPSKPTTPPEQLRAEQLAAQGELVAAAEIYWGQAALAKGPVARELQLRAVETLLTPATREAAGSYLNRLPAEGWDGALLVRRRIAEARLALLYGNPDEALAILPESLDTLAPESAANLAGVRAEAYLQKGMTLEGLALLVERHRMPLNEAQRRSNDATIWGTLTDAGPSELNQWYLGTDNAQVAGWVALALIHKQPAPDKETLAQRIDRWNQSYPGHPAAPEYTLRVLDEWGRLSFRPASIAVLLPFSGRYAAAAAAIMAGTLTAYYDDAGVDTPTKVLRIYDTGDKPERVPAIYRQAVSDGADAVIGPLDKKGVSALSDSGELPVVALSLNYLEADREAPSNLYQFGLLPEDEARQTAERISIDGNLNTIVFVPAGRWGGRLRDSFQSRFEELGGRVLAVETYDPAQPDFAAQIQHALLIDQSRQRHRTLQANLRRNVAFEPRRRQDVDSILIVASPRQARLLNPQFRFHFTGDLPVYATSNVYGAAANNADLDLNGIMFADMPLTISDDEQARSLRNSLEETSPDLVRKYPRLVGLGFDAYDVLPSLRWLADRPHERFQGVTGSLSLDARQRIYRQLSWARFEAGAPVLMAPRTEPAAPVTSETENP